MTAEQKYTNLSRITSQFVKDKMMQLSVEGEASNTEADDAIAAAVAEHSKERFQKKVVDYAGNGARMYDLPELWEEGFSEGTLSVEYPLDEESEDPQTLEPNMCRVYQTPTGSKLRFYSTSETNFLPASGETFRVSFGIQHVVNASTFTVPMGEFHSLAKLSASHLALIMSPRLDQAGTNVGRGDIMNTSSKGGPMLEISREYRKLYESEMHPDEDSSEAALVFGVFEEDPLNRGQRYLNRGNPAGSFLEI